MKYRIKERLSHSGNEILYAVERQEGWMLWLSWVNWSSILYGQYQDAEKFLDDHINDNKREMKVMKEINTNLILFMSLLFLASCDKDDDPIEVPTQDCRCGAVTHMETGQNTFGAWYYEVGMVNNCSANDTLYYTDHNEYNKLAVGNSHCLNMEW